MLVGDFLFLRGPTGFECTATARRLTCIDADMTSGAVCKVIRCITKGLPGWSDDFDCWPRRSGSMSGMQEVGVWASCQVFLGMK